MYHSSQSGLVGSFGLQGSGIFIYHTNPTLSTLLPFARAPLDGLGSRFARIRLLSDFIPVLITMAELKQPKISFGEDAAPKSPEIRHPKWASLLLPYFEFIEKQFKKSGQRSRLWYKLRCRSCSTIYSDKGANAFADHLKVLNINSIFKISSKKLNKSLFFLSGQEKII